jgi:hypothetical protein
VLEPEGGAHLEQLSVLLERYGRRLQMSTRLTR